jgi:hypothetical protein
VIRCNYLVTTSRKAYKPLEISKITMRLVERQFKDADGKLVKGITQFTRKYAENDCRYWFAGGFNGKNYAHMKVHINGVPTKTIRLEPDGLYVAEINEMKLRQYNLPGIGVRAEDLRDTSSVWVDSEEQNTGPQEKEDSMGPNYFLHIFACYPKKSKPEVYADIRVPTIIKRSRLLRKPAILYGLGNKKFPLKNKDILRPMNVGVALEVMI